MTAKLTAYNAPDRQLAAWIRSVEAFVRSVAQVVRIEAAWNDDNAPAPLLVSTVPDAPSAASG